MSENKPIGRESISDAAKKIADALAATDTDHRGNVLYQAGVILKNRGQGFTGNLIMAAGVRYGVGNEN